MGDNIARQGHKVIIFSLEQSKIELVTKAVSRLTYEISRGDARTHTNILKSKELDNRTLDAISKYTSEIAPNEIIKEGTFSLNVNHIRDYLKDYVANTKEHPFVIIDYLQILAPSDLKLTDKQQVDYNITTLKKISRDLDIPILVISSFNRSNYYEPAGFDALKESGGIEYTADVIFTMQLKASFDYSKLTEAEKKQQQSIKVQVDEAKKSNPRNIVLTCLKNRNGKTNFSVFYHYNPCFNVFEERKREEQTEI